MKNEVATRSAEANEVDAMEFQSVPCRAKARARELFGSAAEERFFSEPPDYEETTQPSFEYESVGPSRTSSRGLVAKMSLRDVLKARSEEQPEHPLLNGRRRQLRRRVVGTLCAVLVLLWVGFVAHK